MLQCIVQQVEWAAQHFGQFPPVLGAFTGTTTRKERDSSAVGRDIDLVPGGAGQGLPPAKPKPSLPLPPSLAGFLQGSHFRATLWIRDMMDAAASGPTV